MSPDTAEDADLISVFPDEPIALDPEIKDTDPPVALLLRPPSRLN